MAAIDHLVFVCPDLESGAELIARHTGTRPAPGGSHPGRGTHNALAAFDTETYLEVIAVDPAQPEPATSRPFGLTPDVRPHLATFAVHPTAGETLESLVERLAATGVSYTPIAGMRRTRPDGTTLQWRLAFPVDAPLVVPFAIDWGSTPSPAMALASVGALEELVIAGADARVLSTLASLDPRIRTVDGPAGISATVRTGTGTVELR